MIKFIEFDRQGNLIAIAGACKASFFKDKISN